MFFFLSLITADGPAGLNLHGKISDVRSFATCPSSITNKRYHKTSLIPMGTSKTQE
jgi:hypothetical protein